MVGKKVLDHFIGIFWQTLIAHTVDEFGDRGVLDLSSHLANLATQLAPDVIKLERRQHRNLVCRRSDARDSPVLPWLGERVEIMRRHASQQAVSPIRADRQLDSPRNHAIKEILS